MIICPHCKVTAPGRPRSGVKGGKSKVVLTRLSRVRHHDKGERQWVFTAVRTRQCLTCRWKWKTREVPL